MMNNTYTDIFNVEVTEERFFGYGTGTGLTEEEIAEVE